MTEHPNDTAGEPERGEAAERPRGSTEPQSSGKPPAWESEEPIDEKSGGEEQEAEEIAAGTEHGVAEIPRGDFPARRLRDLIERRFPGGLPESSMPWSVEPDELEVDEDRGEDAEDAPTEAEDRPKGASPDASETAPGDAGSSDEN